MDPRTMDSYVKTLIAERDEMIDEITTLRTEVDRLKEWQVEVTQDRDRIIAEASKMTRDELLTFVAESRDIVQALGDENAELSTRLTETVSMERYKVLSEAKNALEDELVEIEAERDKAREQRDALASVSELWSGEKCDSNINTGLIMAILSDRIRRERKEAWDEGWTEHDDYNREPRNPYLKETDDD